MQRFFFVHIMRTGGATFSRQIEWNFEPGEFFPDPNRDDMYAANFEIAYLLGLPAERTSVIRAYAGHFPFYVTEALSSSPTTLTILRDPVQRTISYLQQQLRDDDSAVSLEQIYDQTFLNYSMIWNFQARQFAMTADDQLRCAMDAMELDEDRLALAKENLAKVDMVGLHERYDEFMEDVNTRFGWKTREIPNWHVSEPAVVSETLKARIAADNALDVAFYEYAVDLYHDRRKARL